MILVGRHYLLDTAVYRQARFSSVRGAPTITARDNKEKSCIVGGKETEHCDFAVKHVLLIILFYQGPWVDSAYGYARLALAGG